MLKPDQGFARRDALCENDLKCICKVDNHIGGNTLFSSDCLLKECTDGHERKLFLKNWLDACRQIGKSGWDNMPYEWEPYLPRDDEIIVRPSSFLNAPAVFTSTVNDDSPTSASVVTSTDAVATFMPITSLSTLMTTTSGSIISSSSGLSTMFSTISRSASPEATSVSTQTTIVTSRSLSPGAIGGIVTGILVLVILLGATGYFGWRANKKAKRKTKEVAILGDRVSGCGFQKRIDELLDEGNNSTDMVVRHSTPNGSEDTILRHSPPSPQGMTRMAGASTSTIGVVSASSSVYSRPSLEIARAL
ncbi:hypothetical protein SLS59_004877 [Nothophoma quercina]|uniref:Extracellular membrane protein CFEM domain-containing protein n=1 Tax=Nothophoma quercina TaxID=749835 RepID=A0ABR3RCL4_9PLEO